MDNTDKFDFIFLRLAVAFVLMILFIFVYASAAKAEEPAYISLKGYSQTDSKELVAYRILTSSGSVVSYGTMDNDKEWTRVPVSPGTYIITILIEGRMAETDIFSYDKNICTINAGDDYEYEFIAGPTDFIRENKSLLSKYDPSTDAMAKPGDTKKTQKAKDALSIGRENKSTDDAIEDAAEEESVESSDTRIAENDNEAKEDKRKLTIVMIIWVCLLAIITVAVNIYAKKIKRA